MWPESRRPPAWARDCKGSPRWRSLGQVGHRELHIHADLPVNEVVAAHSRGACSAFRGDWCCEHGGGDGGGGGGGGGRCCSCCLAYKPDYTLLCLLTCPQPARGSKPVGWAALAKEPGARPWERAHGLARSPLPGLEETQRLRGRWDWAQVQRGHREGPGRGRGPRIASGQEQRERLNFKHSCCL